MEELNQLSLTDLKNLAKEKGLKISGKNKKDIIEMLLDEMNNSNSANNIEYVNSVDYDENNYNEEGVSSYYGQASKKQSLIGRDDSAVSSYETEEIITNNKEDFIVEGVL